MSTQDEVTVRLANFGRDTSKAYHRFEQAQARMVEEINDAIAPHGMSPTKVAHDLMGVFVKDVVEPFKAGISPRRV